MIKRLMYCCVVLSLSAALESAAGPVADGVKRAAGQTSEAVFSEVERRVLEDYMAARAGDAGDRDRERDRDRGYDDDDDDGPGAKGKAKAKQKAKGKQKGPGYAGSQGNPKGLPPGIRMKLERGGTLPPGIAKKNLPDDIEARLPPVREGYERVVAAGKVLLVEKATNAIMDVIDGTTGARDSGDERRTDRGRDRDTPDDDKKWWQVWR